MDAVPYSWTRTRAQESFRGSLPTGGTLTRLAQLVAQAEHDSSLSASRTSAECSQGFPDMAELCQHQQEGHPLPKPHQCVSCGRGFSLLSSLQLHICLEEQTGLPHSPPPSSALPHSPPPLPISSLLQSPAPASAPDSNTGPPDSPDPDSDAGPPDSPDPDSPDPDSPDPDSPDPDSPDPDSPASVQCPHCERSIRSSAGLSSHLRSNHASEWILEKKRKSRGPGGRGGRGGRRGRGRGAGRGGGRLPGVSLDRQKVLSCRSCDMVFVSTAKLYLHRKEKHSREPALRWDARPLASKRRKGETYACSTCGKVFLHHLSLRAHAKQHSSQAHDSPRLAERKPGPCRDPPLGEGRRRGRRPRGRRPGGSGAGRPKREQVREEEEEEGEFPCPSCAEVFSQRALLREHAELHQASVRRRCCCVCSQDMEVCRGPGARRQRLYHCMPCQQPFCSLDAFLLHCQVHLLARVEEEEHATPTHTHLNKA
ncbi:zinc finger and SCAN domain-containing protein 10 isoform X1 [Osmerus eperlanus]|uniref:zinc finger and SCAN domain-containing protein 10 isoform X1 n=1 Tax=Osmerus eperlanus TaxID=29151 RepID=UPI002E1568DC